MAVTVYKSGSEWVVSFPYSKEYVNRIKSVGHGRYNPVKKTWHFIANKEVLTKIRQAFLPEIIEIIDEEIEPETELKEACTHQQPNYNLGVFDTYRKELTLKGYSQKTQKAYIGHIKRFLNATRKPDADLVEKDAKDYIFYILENGKVSFSYANQTISALNIFYKSVLGRTLGKMPRPKRTHKLPQVLSQEEVYLILNNEENIKHRTMLFLAYAAGLRVSEVVRLKVSDIDSRRKLIRIQQSKGRKDRYVMLSEVALLQLREYYTLYKPKTWLFQSGTKPDGHLTERSIQRVFERACQKAGLNKEVGIHEKYTHMFQIITFHLSRVLWID